jgi:hypothetical protein
MVARRGPSGADKAILTKQAVGRAQDPGRHQAAEGGSFRAEELSNGSTIAAGGPANRGSGLRAAFGWGAPDAGPGDIWSGAPDERT